jgi:hypothetical protein
MKTTTTAAAMQPEKTSTQKVDYPGGQTYKKGRKLVQETQKNKIEKLVKGFGDADYGPVIEISPSLIHQHPVNRKFFGEGSKENYLTLKADIENRGIQQAIGLIVIDGVTYALDGHRRAQIACQLQFKKEIAIPNAHATERSKRMKTSNAADFLPIYGPWKGHDECRVILFGNNSLISFDPFAKEHSNYNQIVTGGSGSGKSFLTNVLLLQCLRENPKVFIVDIGGSYKKLCDNLDGQYIPISLDAGISLNPFDLPAGENRPSNHKIKFLLGLIEIMTKEDFQTHLSRLERAQIEDLIIGLYEKHKNPRLSNLRGELLNSNDLNLIRIGKILNSWCGATPFGQIIDQETKVSLNKNLISFDLKGLEAYPDLQSVFLYLITDLVWREVQKDKSTMKFLVLDECWKLLESGSGSVFIGEVFRTFRKYYASAIAISQNIDDFAKSSVSQAILPNSSIKWVLMQKGSDKKRLKEVLNLNDKEIEHISSLKQERGQYSETFLMAEDRHVVARVCPTPLEYWIATTDPRDTSKIESLRKEKPELSQLETLKTLAEEYPCGCCMRKLKDPRCCGGIGRSLMTNKAIFCRKMRLIRHFWIIDTWMSRAGRSLIFMTRITAGC